MWGAPSQNPGEQLLIPIPQALYGAMNTSGCKLLKLRLICYANNNKFCVKVKMNINNSSSRQIHPWPPKDHHRLPSESGYEGGVGGGNKP